MLDVTDNIVGGEVVHPAGVRAFDEDDPYLVVAADKGTAALSDTANAIALEYGFWLGDAFASGGSKGYDHKQLGITARGAWESVKRHFRELGRDVDSRPFTVAGIGDMSGDVFGNGMLLSRQIQLVAAFDHRHVFLDPVARRRRRRSPSARGSSRWVPARPGWTTTASLISPGGGVWARTEKSVPLSPEARAALGVEAESLDPDELVRAILRAPVDLLWNGGVGTFVKSSDESHAEVGDRDNDAIRVDGRELRARVVGEGGNLGLTQLGRIEYATRRRPHQHRRDRQLGRRRLLGPRGQHQDPARRGGRARVADARRSATSCSPPRPTRSATSCSTTTTCRRRSSARSRRRRRSASRRTRC